MAWQIGEIEFSPKEYVGGNLSNGEDSKPQGVKSAFLVGIWSKMLPKLLENHAALVEHQAFKTQTHLKSF